MRAAATSRDFYVRRDVICCLIDQCEFSFLAVIYDKTGVPIRWLQRERGCTGYSSSVYKLSVRQVIANYFETQRSPQKESHDWFSASISLDIWRKRILIYAIITLFLRVILIKTDKYIKPL
jgi:hypothetical protein